MSFFFEVFEQKSDFWPTVRRFWYGLHASCCLRRRRTDVIIFLQEQKSFKKKNCTSQNFVFIIIMQ